MVEEEKECIAAFWEYYYYGQEDVRATYDRLLNPIDAEKEKISPEFQAVFGTGDSKPSPVSNPAVTPTSIPSDEYRE